MPGKYFAATSATKPAYSYMDATKRPIVFVGGVTVSSTEDRENPPEPICGLQLADTSLGRGHIMALQLGGPDESENIVPQYQQWQQIGRWRQMEVSAMTACSGLNRIFVAHLHYGNTHASGKDHYLEMCNGNRTIFWDLPVIPTIFDIWLIDLSSKEGKAIWSGILDPAAKANDREANAAKLPSALQTVAKFCSNDDQARQMPIEDLNYWRKDGLGHLISGMFTQYKVDRKDQVDTATSLMNTHGIGAAKERKEMADVMMSPVRETEYEFVGGYGDTIRKQLELDGWPGSEINEFGTNTHLLQAVFHKKKLSGQDVKSNTRRLTAYGKSSGSTVMRRDKLKLRSEPYKNLTETFERGYKGDQFKDEKDQYQKRLDRFKNGMITKT